MSNLQGNCLTTAMGILPHTEVEAALELALSLDIPFWPQLPRFSFYEDMYVQISEHFPGIIVDEENLRLAFSLEKFYEELPRYAELSADPDFFRLSSRYALTLNSFCRQDLSGYVYVRGQSIGPISFGHKILDETLRPIIYHDEVREFLFDFIANKCNAQYRQLREVHPAPFVWLDEPGLEIIFGSFSGYTSERAARDYREFLTRLAGPKGVHLCGNPDWTFLLSSVELDIISLDAFSLGRIFTRYVDEIRRFLDRGDIICWGIVPTLSEEFMRVAEEELVRLLEEMWQYLAGQALDMQQIARQAWLAPARCCLINSDGHATVERAFAVLKRLAARLKEKYIG